MIKLFQQKSNKKFDEYLLAKKGSLSNQIMPSAAVAPYPSIHDIVCATLKAESDVWAKAAELLRKEELSK